MAHVNRIPFRERVKKECILEFYLTNCHAKEFNQKEKNVMFGEQFQSSSSEKQSNFEARATGLMDLRGAPLTSESSLSLSPLMTTERGGLMSSAKSKLLSPRLVKLALPTLSSRGLSL